MVGVIEDKIVMIATMKKTIMMIMLVLMAMMKMVMVIVEKLMMGWRSIVDVQ